MGGWWRGVVVGGERGPDTIRRESGKTPSANGWKENIKAEQPELDVGAIAITTRT